MSQEIETHIGRERGGLGRWTVACHVHVSAISKASLPSKEPQAMHRYLSSPPRPSTLTIQPTRTRRQILTIKCAQTKPARCTPLNL